MGIVDYLFGVFPQCEAAVRRVYWSSPALHGLLSQIGRWRQRRAVPDAGVTSSLAQLEAQLRALGVCAGDILVVHSSMQALKTTGAEPAQVIDMLRGLLGPQGTLVMPAIPRYREAAEGIARMTEDVSTPWLYDRQRTPPWTGALPLKLMRTRGALRGRHPLNTVVAIGAEAESMLAEELTQEDSMPCGPGSAWAYCASRNAKVIGLGVDMAHSLTMIHVAEDCHVDQWPVPGWYRQRRFRVVDAGVETLVKVRERHPRWSMCYAERKLTRDLRATGICRTAQTGALNLWYLESAALLAFLEARRDTGYPYYCWKGLVP